MAKMLNGVDVDKMVATINAIKDKMHREPVPSSEEAGIYPVA